MENYLSKDIKLTFKKIITFPSFTPDLLFQTANLHSSPSMCSVTPISEVTSLVLYWYLVLPVGSFASLLNSRYKSKRKICRSRPFRIICFASHTCRINNVLFHYYCPHQSGAREAVYCLLLSGQNGVPISVTKYFYLPVA